MNVGAIESLVRAMALGRKPSGDDARSATVASFDTFRKVATVQMGDGATVAVKALATVGTLTAGQRVRVTFQAPHGAVITGVI